MKHSVVAGPKRRTGFGSMVVSALLLMLPFIPMGMDYSPILDFLGRLHPIIVHFPIVLILCTMAFEWLFGSFKGPIGVSILGMLYHWSLYSAIAAVIAGYFLYSSGDYGGDLIKYHFWSGVTVAVLLVWCLHTRKRYTLTHRWRWRQLSRTLLFLAGIIVAFAGHQGGALTHGPEFVMEPLQKALHQKNLKEKTVLKSPNSLLVFNDLLLPSFDRTCMKCHNSSNAKSDLDLSTMDAIHAGGKSLKPMIVEGKPEESELYVRVSLPPKHDDFMPPEGKPPLQPAEVQLLYYWIKAGAGAEDTLGLLMQNDTLKGIMDSYLPQLAEQQLSKQAERLERMKTGPRLARMALDLGLEVRPDEDTDSAYYSLSMQFPPKVVTDETLAKLLPYKDYFSKVSLVGADISDEGLYYIGQMSNLQSLILTKSCIKGDGLQYLKDLPKLQMLNLSHTDLNDKNFLFLSQFPALKRVFVFNTEVTPEMVKVLDEHLRNAKVTLEEGDYY